MILPANGEKTQKFSAAHPALDIANVPGTNVVAPHAGKITLAGDAGDCGLALDIDGGTYKSRLCHNQSLLVGLGASVKEGQHIAEMGFTGYTEPDNVPAGSHVHWVLWKNDVRVDPEKHLKEEDVVTKLVADCLYRFHLGTDASPYALENYVGKKTSQELVEYIRASERYKKYVESGGEMKDILQHLPRALR